MLWEWRGIANLAFIQLGWVSRVDEMILARVSSGFAGEEVSSHSKGFSHTCLKIFSTSPSTKIGLWYPKDSPFHLEAFSDSDYAGDNHDRRSNLQESQ
ncbi:hypothetical protein Tco_1135053 [Tanacetum coccineum]